jgi:hypothetical protein
MQLKRKRSTDVSTSTSHFSATSHTTSTTSASRQSHSPSPFQSHPASHEAPGVNSRTLKRYRDNRPPEDMIYQKTLHRLYAAQRQGHNAGPVLSPPLDETTSRVGEGDMSGQKSLDAFWRIPSAQEGSQIRLGPSVAGESQGARCEDCDSPMKESQTDGEGDYDMTETASLETIAHSGGGQCTTCAKMVCGLCSLVREYRVCLECAGKGWT